MPRAPHRPKALVRTVFRGADALERGLLTKNQLYSSAWRPVLRGVFADPDLPLTHVTMCRAAQLVMPPEAVIAGRSAAALHGVPYLGGADPVEVIVPPGIRFGPVAGLIIRSTRLGDTDVQRQGGIRCTTSGRTCWDIASGLFGHDLIESVVFLDAMLRTGTVDPGVAYRQFAMGRPRPRGFARARQAYLLADSRAESPPESRLRVSLVLAGIPKPVPQYEITMDGRFVARVDLAWHDHRLAVEYDGHWHADAAQLRKDRRRLNRLVTAGWTVLHVTDDRLRHDLDGIVAEISAALRYTDPDRFSRVAG